MAGEHVITGGRGVSGDNQGIGCGDEGEEVSESGEANMAQSIATQAEIFGKLDEFIGV